MTQQELKITTEQWYASSPDYVILFTGDWRPIWENRPCPMLAQSQGYPAGLQLYDLTPRNSHRYLIRYNGDLYSAQLYVHNNDTDPLYYLVQIDAEPYFRTLWRDSFWTQRAQSEVVNARNQVYQINSALLRLYNVIEENSDQYPRMTLDDMMQDLNTIQSANCALMRPTVYLDELARYHQEQDIEQTPIILDQVLSEFTKKCHDILGRSVSIRLKTDEYLCVRANFDRLANCLLCQIRLMQQQCGSLSKLEFEAGRQNNGIFLTITATSGKRTPIDEMPTDPGYRAYLHTPEEQLVQLFCEVFHVTRFTTTAPAHSICTLTFPEDGRDDVPVLHSNESIYDNSMMSIYHLMLSDISSYRFF